jgi:putative transposase
VVNQTSLAGDDVEALIWGEMGDRSRAILQRLLELSMESEVTERLGYLPYARDPAQHSNYRNGCYRRTLETQYGVIESLRVPRVRQGGTHYRVLERYGRRAPWVNQLIQELYLAGVSTRRVGVLLEELLGASVSATVVSRVCANLSQLVRTWHHRPLADEYQYLFVDGVALRTKGAAGVRTCLALCAYGITREGRREIIDYRLGRGESEAECVALLNDLYRRGLTGAQLELIVTDGGQGWINAAQLVFPHVPRQRCWAHKLRNVANKLRAKHRPECLAGARTIYQATTQREAVACFRSWAATWQEREPAAVACLRKDLDALLSFFRQPKAHHRKVRTTNVIERQFREVRRRTNPMTCFATEASADRILYTIFQYSNTRWAKSLLREFTHKS